MFHPSELHGILRALNAQNWNAIIVGGQAINILAEAYTQDRKEEWGKLLPFTSEDLDFLGGPIEIAILKKTLMGRCKVNKNFDPSPNAGVMLTPWNGTNLRINVLTYILGVDSAEAESSALTVPLGNKTEPLVVRVLHPMLCLTSKAHCLRHLPQTNRQDDKQLQMAVLTLNGYLRQKLELPRPVLNLIKRIFATAETEEGLHAHTLGIPIEEAIPIREMKASGETQYKKFVEMEFPRAVARLNDKRKSRATALARLRKIDPPPTQKNEPPKLP